MKPLFHELVRLSRCPCCHSIYSRCRYKHKRSGKSPARFKQKQDIRKQLTEDVS